MINTDVEYSEELIHWLRGGTVWFRAKHGHGDWGRVTSSNNILSLMSSRDFDFTKDEDEALAGRIKNSARPEDGYNSSLFHYRVALMQDKLGTYYTQTEDTTCAHVPEEDDREFVCWLTSWQFAPKSGDPL